MIEKDPIIEYDLGKFSSNEQKRVTLTLDKPLTQANLDTIKTSVNHEQDREGLEAIRRQQEVAQQYSDITRKKAEFVKDGLTFTTVTTTIKPKKGLKNVTYYQEIPKCLAEHIDDLEFKNKDLITVVSADPLIMWHFDDVASAVDMSYDVKGVISEECLKQIKDLALAEALGLDLRQDKTPKLLATLLAVPLLAFVIIYFGKFKGRLKREEVVAVKSAEQLAKEAKQQAEHEEKRIENAFDRQIQKAEDVLKKEMR